MYVSRPQNSCHLSHTLLGLGMPRTRASSTLTEQRAGPPATSALHLSPSARNHKRNRAAHPARGSGRPAEGSPRSRRCGQTLRRVGPYLGATAGRTQARLPAGPRSPERRRRRRGRPWHRRDWSGPA